MKVVFAGTPAFALPSLQALFDTKNIDVGMVITQPPRARGRGLKRRPTPVASLGYDLGLQVRAVEDINAPVVLKEMAAYKLDFLVVVAFGQKLGPSILQLPGGGAINLHASLLPRYRGANPVVWTILNGDQKTGVTTILMDDGWDTGPVLMQKEVTINPEETGGELHNRLAVIGAGLLVETLVKFTGGKLKPRPQLGTPIQAPKLKKDDYYLDWRKEASTLSRKVKALNPWPVARIRVGEEELKIWRVTGVELPYCGQPGQVLQANVKDGLLVQTGQGQLKIELIQRQGKKVLPAIDFLKGFPLQPGTILEGGGSE